MIDTGSTAFIMICAALVFFMTPGLAFFYGGMVRRKNVVNTMMSSFFIIGLATVMWFAFGYALAFGGNHAGIIGGSKWFFLNGVGMKAGPYAKGIPNLVYCAFQMMFAIITPALITGAVAGRMRFKALFFFILFWSLLVYYPLAHMVWGEGGFLAAIGSVDFAGGNVVHISSGISALVLCLILGKRKDYSYASYRVHNIPFIALGAAILNFGWFGFNAGSALAANGLAAQAFMTSAVSAACALMTWMLMDVIVNGKPTLIGASTGMVIGLVAITPGAGFVPVWASAIIGALASPICYFMVSVVKKRFGYDDALDAFGCHGVGGIFGGLMTGVFGSQAINPALRWNGLIFGNVHLFGAQVLAILVTIAVAIVGTLICVFLVKLITPLRVESRDEAIGLDRAEHDEVAYPSFNGLD
ncbi:MAG: ammonium transporter [Intestinibaculum porci]|uniref:ammonium transporter n=1 Tax=Intestinibaculum porci TaxID=2487118 RepID=UPI00240972B2|nr:ammonium transporter [Intestinibaculum porci]MDD6423370.1 ammonium transporter [Intestinibaculum porci]